MAKLIVRNAFAVQAMIFEAHGLHDNARDGNEPTAVYEAAIDFLEELTQENGEFAILDRGSVSAAAITAVLQACINGVQDNTAEGYGFSDPEDPRFDRGAEFDPHGVHVVASHGPVPGSIYDYFKARLGFAPTDETLRELPVDSGCGDDCRAAIDAAAAYLPHAAKACDGSADMVKRSVDQTVQVFWRG